jgi:hypothetical protein
MNELITWGKCDSKSAQGWAKPTLDRRYWTASFSGTHDTHEKDGKVTYKNHAWVSETEKNVSYPYAVVDDFGYLTPVSTNPNRV